VEHKGNEMLLQVLEG